MLPSDFPSADAKIPGMESVSPTAPSGIHGEGNLDSGIPGLDSFGRGATLSETVAALPTSDIEEASQEQVMSFGQRSPLNIVPSISTDRSEEISPKADVHSATSSAATSDKSFRLVLPKMTAPVVDLADEQTDNLQKLTFIRIIDAYKQISVAGGSKFRFSILAYLGVEVMTSTYEHFILNLFSFFIGKYIIRISIN